MTRLVEVELTDGDTVTMYHVTFTLDIEGLHIDKVQQNGTDVEYDTYLWRSLRTECGYLFDIGEAWM